MDQRDQELLDKQLQRINPAPRNNGVMAVAILAMFFAGMTFGGFLTAYKNEPVQIAANESGSATSLLPGAPITARQ